MSAMTLRAGIQETIRSKIPEIVGVEAINGLQYRKKAKAKGKRQCTLDKRRVCLLPFAFCLFTHHLIRTCSFQYNLFPVTPELVTA